MNAAACFLFLESGWLAYVRHAVAQVDDRTFSTTEAACGFQDVHTHVLRIHVAGGDFSFFRRYLPRYG
jgi:hypothetical protein